MKPSDTDKTAKSKCLMVVFWFVSFVVVVISMRFLFPNDQQAISNIIQAQSVITLVLITFYYALQTKNLVEEQKRATEESKRKIQVDFLEKRINDFYYPFNLLLDNVIEICNGSGNINVRANTKKELEDLYWKRSYMTSISGDMVSNLCSNLLVLNYIDDRRHKEDFSHLQILNAAVREVLLKEWGEVEKEIIAFYPK